MLELVRHRSAIRNTVLGRETSEAQSRFVRVSTRAYAHKPAEEGKRVYAYA